MIRSTALTVNQRVKLAAERRAQAQARRKSAVNEYALLLVMMVMAATVNFLNWRSDAQDEARSFAARHMREGQPKPPYMISTAMRKEAILISDVKIERQWYFNDDATMRYVDTVPAESADKIGYIRNDVVFASDRRRKVWQKTDVAHGDFGRPASFITFAFNYKTDADYNVSVISATPGGWRWTHHKDTFENEQLVSQIVYDRSGNSVKRVYAPNPNLPILPNDDDDSRPIKPAEVKPVVDAAKKRTEASADVSK